MGRLVEFEEIAGLFRDGMTVMSAGFMGVGAADRLLERLAALWVGNLTLITSDTARPGFGAGRLISAGRVSRLIASHIGTNPDTGRLMTEGLLDVELSPQGTLVERIRAGGCGLGGILTPTGLGTEVEKGKRRVEVGGREYLLEAPLRADVALLRGGLVDRYGNVRYRGTARNFNPAMAMAADIVIVEAEEYLADGAIDPDDVMTPGLLVDYVVRGRGAR